MISKSKNNTTVKRTFWAVFAFYFIIAFEFFYMASPFAVYFYSIYRPGLNLLNSIPGIAWLSTFFLPHIVVETASPLINFHNAIGAILFLIGILVFAACAGQVYYHKLARKAEVTGGLYRYIRHPQYAGFMLSSLGMLVMWPRFLALVMFVSVCFVYYFLARIEEGECETKFGQSYVEYKNHTGMFLPFKQNLFQRLHSLPRTGLARLLSIVALYAVVMGAAILSGYGIKLWALNSLYAIYTPEAVYVSVAEIDPSKLEQVKTIALSDASIQTQLDAAGPDARFINYVAPSEWFISEVPMNNGRGHIEPGEYDHNAYKVVFTLAQLPEGRSADGQQILMTAVHKSPIIEVWVNLAERKINKILAAPETVQYNGVPVPIY